MTVYLLCYDLQQEVDDQISYWLQYLNVLLLQVEHTSQHPQSFKIFIVGLRADGCSDKQSSKASLFVNSWRSRVPNLIIHDKTFQLSAHTDYEKLESLANELGTQFNILFESHAKQVPVVYQRHIETVHYSNWKDESTSYYGDNAGYYLHSIGKVVYLANRYLNPEEIASNLAKFISPKSVRYRLLTRDHGTTQSMLTRKEIGAVLETDDSEQK